MQVQTINTINTDAKRKRRTKITPEHKDKIVELASKALTTREIETLTNVDHTTVAKILQRYGLEKRNIDDYIANRAEIFAGLQDRILKTINDDDVKKMPATQRIVASGILYDKERLERGQSTDNIGVIGKIIHEMKGIEDNDE